MRKRLQISISALITFSLSFLLIFFSLFSALSQLNRYESYLLQNRNTETLTGIQELKKAIAESQVTFNDYLTTENTYKLIDYHEAMRSGRESLATLSYLIGDAEEAAFTLSMLEQSYRSYGRQCEKAFELFGLGREDYYQQKQNADMIAYYMSIYADELLSLTIANNVDSLAEDSRSYSVFLSINLIVLFLFALMIIIILFVFSKNIRRPLGTLANTASRIAEGDLDARADTDSRDRQVNLLTETFNDMADDIIKMMEEMKMKVAAEKLLLEEQKKNLEVEAQLDRATFLALQTQTNPHFLFNTLNTIDRTIQLGKTEDARRMLHSISALMRYNLSDGNIPAVLREEIEVTKEYLSIQKARFSERLSYEIGIDDTLLDTVFLPRFTLQPLVENAIIHGLTGKEEGGCVSIYAKEDADGNVILTIEDDGVGMSEEAVDMAMRKSWRSSKHIGISNTRHRMELFAKESGVFTIESELGKGTRINIRLRRA
ncbi:MAG TPA: histidine kinase [Candidatus Ornithospirochaeta stercorigallinarum]|nr:histidine kinase [Candidatus Ornithospirochaeta stercorigallinarum]